MTNEKEYAALDWAQRLMEAILAQARTDYIQNRKRQFIGNGTELISEMRDAAEFITNGWWLKYIDIDTTNTLKALDVQAVEEIKELYCALLGGEDQRLTLSAKCKHPKTKTMRRIKVICPEPAMQFMFNILREQIDVLDAFIASAKYLSDPKTEWKNKTKRSTEMNKKRIAELSDIQRINMAIRGEGLDVLKSDPYWKVRVAVAEQGYALDELKSDPDEWVRRAVAKQGYALDELKNDPDCRVRATAMEEQNKKGAKK